MLLLTVVGLGAELALLEHYEEPLQWTPLVTLTLTAALTAWVWLRPERRTILAFRGLMLLCVPIALAGIWFHYRANAALELEMNADIAGTELLWSALHGGVPALAPGAILQIGLIGLVATWRHPALVRTTGEPTRSTPSSIQQETFPT